MQSFIAILVLSSFSLALAAPQVPTRGFMRRALFSPSNLHARGLDDPNMKGEVTYYDNQGKGACEVDNNTSQYNIALNGPDFGFTRYQRKKDSPACGACVEAFSPSSQAPPLIMKITNVCPECKPGDIDVSQAAFEHFHPIIKGRVDIQWSRVQCPSNDSDLGPGKGASSPASPNPQPVQSQVSSPPPAQSQVSSPPPAQSQVSSPLPAQSQVPSPPPSQSQVAPLVSRSPGSTPNRTTSAPNSLPTGVKPKKKCPPKSSRARTGTGRNVRRAQTSTYSTTMSTTTHTTTKRTTTGAVQSSSESNATPTPHTGDNHVHSHD